MPCNFEIFLLRRVTWNYDCLISIIMNKLKLYNCAQTNDYYLIEINT